ncbi:MAG TPA: DUF3298 domain-containing protein [Candidatus Paceibacterota bacterium]|nr:DUF3298 domain-containing protein [Candidatus Paceibacterota bacterium]
MKNKPFYIVLVILLLIIIVVIYKNPKTKEEAKINNQDVSTVNEEDVVAGTFETKTLNPDDAYVKIDVKYPYFKNADAGFNLRIENFLKNGIEEHKNISKDNWQARFETQTAGENIPKVPAKEEEKFYFYSDYTVIQSNSTYISFVLIYGGYSGGAHGYENRVSYNYDLKNHKDVMLKDLFPNNPQYLNYISERSRESLKKAYATPSEEDKKNSSQEDLKAYFDNILSMIDIGTEPKEENFTAFTFTDEKVKIYFGQYQVGPYAIGSPEVEIKR